MSINSKSYNVQALETDSIISRLVEWRKKYPKATIVPVVSEKLFSRYGYAKTDDEYEIIKTEYSKIQEYYQKLVLINSQGELNEEQFLRCKDGDVGGIFGYPTKVEKIVQKYNISEEDIYYVFDSYGSIEEFNKRYNSGQIVNSRGKRIGDKLFCNIVDIDQNPNEGFNMLYNQISKKKFGLKIYSSEQLKRAIFGLTSNSKEAIKYRFGLEEGTKPIESLEDIAEQIRKKTGKEIKPTAVYGRLKKAYDRLSSNKDSFNVSIDMSYFTKEEKDNIRQITMDIQLRNGDLSENIEKLKAIIEENEKRKESGSVDKSALEAHLEDTYINVLYLSKLAYNCLNRSGISTLADLDKTSPEDLMKIRNLGRKSFEEIINKYRKYKEEKERELVKREDSKQASLSEVNLENMTLEQLQNIIDENKQKIESSGNLDVNEERECFKTIIKAQNIIISKYKDVIRHSVNEQRGTKDE